MPELTPEQQLAADAIDAADMIARSAGEVAIALQEAARALRLALSPRFVAVDHAGPTGDTTGFWVADQDGGACVNSPVDERSDAGFCSGPIWIGGLGKYEGPGVYWSEADRGITHKQLMDACEGLSDAERREVHLRVRERALNTVVSPSVRDLLDALAWVRQHKAEAAAPFDLAADVDWAPGDDGLEQRSLLDAVEAMDGPKPAELPLPAAETDASLRAFLRAKQSAGEELASDVVEAEALARVAPALHRSPDLGGAWRGVSGSQAVDAVSPDDAVC
jgi:hypothetical protein